MNYVQIGIVITVIIVLAITGYFVFMRPPTPSPPPCTNPPCPSPPPPPPSWPMQKEVFFVHLSTNTQVSISNWSQTDQLQPLSIADLIRMYHGYSVAQYTDVFQQVKNGMQYNNNNPFYLYTTFTSGYRSGGNTPAGKLGIINVNGTQTTYTGPVGPQCPVAACTVPLDVALTFGEQIYPVYGYKPIQQFTDAKGILFSRTSGTVSSTYINQNGSGTDISYSWDANNIQATILPFNSQYWGYYGYNNAVNKSATNMTGGNELFIVKMSSLVTPQTPLGTGYSIGNLDQYNYSASQGANNFIYSGLVDNTGAMIYALHGNVSNPSSSGLAQQMCSYTPSGCQRPQYMNLNSNNYATWWTPTVCDSNKDNLLRIPNFANPTWDKADYVTLGVDNGICGDGLYLFVWGIKPGPTANVKLISSNAVSIEPFMITQAGSKWSMYN